MQTKKRMNPDEQCRARVWGNFNFHRCPRKAVKDGYCYQHHPEAVQKRKEEAEKRSEEAQQQSPWAKLERARKRIEELETTLKKANERIKELEGEEDANQTV